MINLNKVKRVLIKNKLIFLIASFFNKKLKFITLFKNVDINLICIDVGASYFSNSNWWLPRDICMTRWIAIDAMDKNLTYTNEWIFDSTIYTEVAAISSTNNICEFYITPIDSGSSMLKPTKNIDIKHRMAPEELYFPFNTIEIKTKSLRFIVDKYSNDKSNIVLKIDTQGTELEILKSIQEKLTYSNVIAIEVESSFHNQTFYKNAAKFWQVCEFLEKYDFELIGQNLVPFLGCDKTSQIPNGSNMALNESDGLFVLRRSKYSKLDVKLRVSILIVYITYNYLYEAIALLKSDKELRIFLNSFDIDSDKLNSYLLQGL